MGAQASSIIIETVHQQKINHHIAPVGGRRKNLTLG
jgi:hypothetical protein